MALTLSAVGIDARGKGAVAAATLILSVSLDSRIQHIYVMIAYAWSSLAMLIQKQQYITHSDVR